MDVLAQGVVWLNAVANVAGDWLLVPIGLLPGWLSATLVAAVTGVVLLIVFKHTSNQRAIKAARIPPLDEDAIQRVEYWHTCLRRLVRAGAGLTDRHSDDLD